MDTVTRPYGETFYRFRNADSNGDAELELFDVIGFGFFGGKSAKQFRKELKDVLSADPKPKRLIIRVNSPGGSAFDGFAMANSIREVEIPTVSIVEGWAASAASTVAIAADTVRMHKTSMMMIHNPWSFAFGESKDMRKEAEILDKIRDVIAEDYERKSEQPLKKIIEAMDAETWFKATDAREFGLADEVIDGAAKNNVLAWDVDALPFKNMKPEYYTVSESPGAAVFNGAIPSSMFTAERRVRDAVFARASHDPMRGGFDVHAAPRRVPGSVTDRAETARAGVAGVRETTAQGDDTMGTEQQQAGASASPGTQPASGAQSSAGGQSPAGAAVTPGASAPGANTSASSTQEALSAERKRVKAILSVASPRTMALANKLIDEGVSTEDAVVQLAEAKAGLPASVVGGAGSGDIVPEYGSGATAEGGDDSRAAMPPVVGRKDAEGQPFTGAKKKFYDAVDAQVKATSCTEQEAVRAVRASNPDLHADAFNLPKLARTL